MISDGANLRGLCAKVITGAIEDLYFSRSPVKQLEAYDFLTSKEYRLFADVAGRDLELPVEKIIARPRQVKPRLRQALNARSKSNGKRF